MEPPRSHPFNNRWRAVLQVNALDHSVGTGLDETRARHIFLSRFFPPPAHEGNTASPSNKGQFAQKQKLLHIMSLLPSWLRYLRWPARAKSDTPVQRGLVFEADIRWHSYLIYFLNKLSLRAPPRGLETLHHIFQFHLFLFCFTSSSLCSIFYILNLIDFFF